MAIQSLKRYDLVHFLDVTPVGATRDYRLLSPGVTTASINYNPQMIEEAYIADRSGTKQLESISPEMPLEMSGKAGDPVFDFIDNIIWTQALGTATETTLVTVQLYKKPTTGAYPAKQQKVSVSYESTGDEALQALKNNVSLLFMGDPVFGTFNPTTREFTATP